MAVTMRDIAEDLNVSIVTVSKVLRSKGNISAATRRRVLRRAKELNYQTNWVTRSLVTRRTFTIGLLLPDFTHPGERVDRAQTAEQTTSEEWRTKLDLSSNLTSLLEIADRTDLTGKGSAEGTGHLF